jgi:predicted nucleic acid-binding protein
MVLVDSSAWIEAFRRKGDLYVKLAVEALLEEYEATICPPVRLEVLGGCRQEERRIMSNAFDILPHVPLVDEDWERAVQYAWRLQEKGITVPWNDLLIATVSLRCSCRVYALNKHFRAMAPVIGVVLYEPSYNGGFNAEPSV